jgi:CO/xanthine dehydrogenase Mo-binding subunit
MVALAAGQTRGLADYLVAVNADAPDVDVDLVEVRDEIVNPLGVKGVGEIGPLGTYLPRQPTHQLQTLIKDQS